MAGCACCIDAKAGRQPQDIVFRDEQRPLYLAEMSTRCEFGSANVQLWIDPKLREKRDLVAESVAVHGR